MSGEEGKSSYIPSGLKYGCICKWLFTIWTNSNWIMSWNNKVKSLSCSCLNSLWGWATSSVWKVSIIIVAQMMIRHTFFPTRATKHLWHLCNCHCTTRIMRVVLSMQHAWQEHLLVAWLVARPAEHCCTDSGCKRHHRGQQGRLVLFQLEEDHPLSLQLVKKNVKKKHTSLRIITWKGSLPNNK